MGNSVDIRFFTNPGNYGFLSNFHENDSLEIDGEAWPTVEHYYQAMKFNRDAVLEISREDSTLLETIQSEIRNAAKPIKAKRIAQKYGSIHCPEIWHSGKSPLKDQVMAKALSVKFAPGTELATKLLSTSSAVIVEDNPWDSYWGIGEDGRGRNRMGQLLMEQREKLCAESDKTNQ